MEYGRDGSLPNGQDILYRCNKPVTQPWKRFYIPRILRSIVQGAAQFFNRAIQAVLKINKRVGGPQSLLHFFPRDHFAGFLEEHHQDGKRLSWQPHTDAMLPELAR